MGMYYLLIKDNADAVSVHQKLRKLIPRNSRIDGEVSVSLFNKTSVQKIENMENDEVVMFSITVRKPGIADNWYLNAGDVKQFIGDDDKSPIDVLVTLFLQQDITKEVLNITSVENLSSEKVTEVTDVLSTI